MTPHQAHRTALTGRARLLLWGGAAVLLLAPAVAMRFAREVNWGPGDFAIFAAMLVAAGAAFELAMARTPRPRTRIAIGVAIAAVFLLVWAQLAVGIV